MLVGYFPAVRKGLVAASDQEQNLWSIMASGPPIILASASPRRQYLLSALGVSFQVIVADIDETPLPKESPAEMARRLSLAKAQKVAQSAPESIVIAADTLVAVDSQVLGKPPDADQAFAMLDVLRGRAHSVFSGLAFVRNLSGQAIVQVVETGVVMRAYTDQEMWNYINSGDPMDKAGAYAIQHGVFDPVDRITQCYTNVMGLPMCHVVKTLLEWQVETCLDPLAACPYAVDHGRCPWAADILGRRTHLQGSVRQSV